MELDAQHAVAEIDERCAGILLHDAVSPLQIGEHDDAGARLKGAVVLLMEIEIEGTRLIVAVFVAIERHYAARESIFDRGRQHAPFRF